MFRQAHHAASKRSLTGGGSSAKLQLPIEIEELRTGMGAATAGIDKQDEFTLRRTTYM
jgi:hypothetical protein